MTAAAVSNVRLRRSALYMPASNARALDKARSLPVDVLILDLEDAVAPDAKEAARAGLTAAVAAGGYGGRELVARVNALNTPWGRDDLAAVARLNVAAALTPKVESAAQIRETADLLDAFGASPDVKIWAMIETPRALLRLEEIAGAHDRLEALVLGTSDLVKDLRGRHTPDRSGLTGLLQLTVAAARAFGLSVLDGVHLSLDDDDGLRAVCEQGRAVGFDGKTLIHPRQAAAANAAFGPSEREIAEAKEMIAAFAVARENGSGVAVASGRLVEELHVREAERLLALAAAAALVK